MANAANGFAKRRVRTKGAGPLHRAADCIYNEGMPLLQIRNLPDELYQTLARKAAEERRSLSQQAIVVLSKGLEAEIDPKARLRRVLAEIKRRHAGRGKSLSDPAKLIS